MFSRMRITDFNRFCIKTWPVGRALLGEWPWASACDFLSTVLNVPYDSRSYQDLTTCASSSYFSEVAVKHVDGHETVDWTGPLRIHPRARRNARGILSSSHCEVLKWSVRFVGNLTKNENNVWVVKCFRRHGFKMWKLVLESFQIKTFNYQGQVYLWRKDSLKKIHAKKVLLVVLSSQFTQSTLFWLN